MVLLLDDVWKGWSDNTIAKHCHVTHPFVGKLRKELEPKPALPKKEAEVVTVTTTTPEANNGAGVASEKPSENPEKQPEKTELSTSQDKDVPNKTPEDPPYDPKADELAEAHNTVVTLAEENAKLRDGIALAELPEEERKETSSSIEQNRG